MQSTLSWQLRDFSRKWQARATWPALLKEELQERLTVSPSAHSLELPKVALFLSWCCKVQHGGTKLALSSLHQGHRDQQRHWLGDLCSPTQLKQTHALSIMHFASL